MRVATLYDGIAGGRSGFNPDRDRIADEGERARVCEFLRAGAVLNVARVLDTDWLDPGLDKKVPVGFATDGEWTWHLGLAYYVEKYGIAPDPGLYAHIKMRQYVCRTLNAAEREAALSELFELLRQGHTHEHDSTHDHAHSPE